MKFIILKITLKYILDDFYLDLLKSEGFQQIQYITENILRLNYCKMLDMSEVIVSIIWYDILTSKSSMTQITSYGVQHNVFYRAK